MGELVKQIIYGSLGVAFGFILVLKAHSLVDEVGRNNWAEMHLGAGGTYTLVRLIGGFLMFIFFAYMVGMLGPIYLTVVDFFYALIGGQFHLSKD